LHIRLYFVILNLVSISRKEIELNIYVGNLPKTASEDAIRQLFEAHGQVDSVKLIKDNFSGELRGFGFVEMPASAEGQAAIAALAGYQLEGRALTVNEARPKPDRPGGGGAGGGRPRSGGGGGGFRGGSGGGPRRW
jgi:cold-inducible RNA-binding protein